MASNIHPIAYPCYVHCCTEWGLMKYGVKAWCEVGLLSGIQNDLYGVGTL